VREFLSGGFDGRSGHFKHGAENTGRSGSNPELKTDDNSRAERFPFGHLCHYDWSMALVRILVDGYSLLHNWPELARGKARHSAAAREELVHVLTQYQDATGTPVTIFFDGGGAPPGTPKNESGNGVEVLFSKSGQTADDMIERAAHRFEDYGEVMAVTNDNAERDTVIGFNGSVASCENFILMVKGTLNDLNEDVKQHNQTERNRFTRSR
jgi:uncharacterized protein